MAIVDPTDITGCVLWLDPGTITATDGDSIGSWTDQSGNSNDATSSGVDRPIYRDGSDWYHGQPTLEFNDVGHRLEVAAAASLANSQVTYAIMCRLSSENANTDPQWLMNKVNANPSTVGIRVADSDIANAGKYEAFYRLSATPSTARTVVDRGPYRGAWTLLMFRYDGTTGELYIDDQVGGSTAVSGSIQTTSNGKLWIGNHPTVDNAFLGQIGDVVVYNSALGSTDRADLVAWFKAKYPNSEYVKTASVLSTGIRHIRVRSASDTGLTDNQMLVVTTSGAINHYTSPTSDPHNWTLANSGVVATDASYRTLDFIVVSGTWYVYIDRAASNGSIELFTGAAVTSLTEHGSSPIITGSVGDYPRTPGVYNTGSSWTMLLDVRTDSVTGSYGYIDRWTSSDGISWTKDTVNSPVLSPTGNGFESTDVGHPSIYKEGSTYYLVYAGYNADHPLVSEFPHEIGLATSSDLITFTRSNKNPILTHDHGSSSFDQVFVANPCLFNDGSNITLYYSGSLVGTTIQPGYATGAASNYITRDVSQTFLVQSLNTGTYFYDAADRIFFFGAYPGPLGGPSGEIGQEATHNFIYLDVADTLFVASNGGFAGYNQDADIHQYIGFTDREFADCRNEFFTATGANFVGVVIAIDCDNTFDFNLHDDGEAAYRTYPVSNSLGFTDSILYGSFIDVYDQITWSDSIDTTGTDFGSGLSQSFIKQHISFSVSGSNPEKTYTPFIGESGDTSYPPVAASAPTLGTGVLTLTHPRVSPTLTLVLKNPDFGNSDVLRFTKIDRRTRGGDRKIFSDLGWGSTQSFELQISNICNTNVTIDNILDFLNTSLGEEIGLLDWENRQWKGIIVAPETEVNPTVTGHSVKIVFEGELV